MKDPTTWIFGRCCESYLRMRNGVLSKFARCVHVIDNIIVNAVEISLIAPPYRSERQPLSS